MEKYVPTCLLRRDLEGVGTLSLDMFRNGGAILEFGEEEGLKAPKKCAGWVFMPPNLRHTKMKFPIPTSSLRDTL